ncbi:MAG: mannose-1-phosphate guanylyltransferase [Candidatus Eremiobacterota bacterium]
MFAVIMAGGVGKRFWPYSRNSLPKQFLSIIGEETMLTQTLNRLDGFIAPENRIIVINEEHKDLIPSENKSLILKEPFGKNTAPCVGLASVYIKDTEAPVAVVPADHFIPDREIFQKTLKEAMDVAKKGYIVTIGVKPTGPETGYGYILRGDSLEDRAYMVKRFVEKPDINKAIEYLVSGEYFWNSGIFVFTPHVMLEEISILLPDLYEKLQIIKESIGKKEHNNVLRDVYSTITSVSIDYGIMEKTKRPVAVIPASFEWSDVGSWKSLFDLQLNTSDGNGQEQGNIIEGPCVSIDTKHCFICNKTDKLVATIGLEDLFLVNTDDAVLAGHMKDSQKVQDIIEILKKKGLNKYL